MVIVWCVLCVADHYGTGWRSDVADEDLSVYPGEKQQVVQ